MSKPPTEEEWAMFEALPFPATIYKHTCKAGGFTIMGRQCFGPEWVDHKHYAANVGDAIRIADSVAQHEAKIGNRYNTACVRRSRDRR